MVELTAIIKKGDKQFVAFCPELDVVSQGFSIEEAVENLKEACGLYVREMGLPEGIGKGEIYVSQIGVREDVITNTVGL